jgi:hypothetical protein
MTQAAHSPSPDYQKALLELWVNSAKQSTAKSSRRFMHGHVIVRAPELPIHASSYAEEERSALATVSAGTPVERPWGTEILRIAPDAVNLWRLKNSGIPLLDTHQLYSIDAALGRVAHAWVNNSALVAKITFNETPLGEMAAGMVERGEIVGVSPGYHVEEWEITDQDGRVLDPETDRIRLDESLTFTATRWELLELSLASVPSDPLAVIRSHTVSHERAAGIGPRAAAEARARMQARHDRAVAPRGRERLNTAMPTWQGNGMYGRRPHYRVTSFAN